MTKASADSITAIKVASSKGANSTPTEATGYLTLGKQGCPELSDNTETLSEVEKTTPNNRSLIIASLIIVLLHLVMSESAWASSQQKYALASNVTETLMLDLNQVDSIYLRVSAQISIDDCDDFGEDTLQIKASADTIRPVDIDQQKESLTVNLNGQPKELIKIHLHKKRLKQLVSNNDDIGEPRFDVELKGSRVGIDVLIVSDLFVRLSAQSHFEIGQLQADNVDIRSSDESLLRVSQVEADQLSVTAKHAAEIELTGKVFSQSAMTSNNSRYNARAMQSQLAEVFMRDNSAVLMHVERQVSFDMHQPSSLHLQGGAQIIN